MSAGAARAREALDVAPLPDFAAVEGAIAEALPALRPQARVSVADVAPRRNVETDGQWVPWRNDVAPYMVEPMRQVTSRRFDSLVFVGPARASKSEALVLNVIAHAVLAQPRKVAVFSPRKQAAQEWSEGQLSPFIVYSPEIRARLAPGKSADNVFTKRFRGGTRLTVDWPVPDKLAQRSLHTVIATDYDAFDADIGGDGQAFALMRKRTEQAGTRGMTIVESSPRYPIVDERWRPASAHEAPPAEGIVQLYNAGTRARLYWTCPACETPFEPRFERLEWPADGTAQRRAEKAVMVCPHCGGVIEPARKRALNEGAVWLHEEEDGSAAAIGDLARRVATVSYLLTGPAAALASWARIAERWIEAHAHYKRIGDEAALRSVTNVELGLPYLPKARLQGAGLHEDALRGGATDHPWQEAPARTAFILVGVDVQVGRFVVQAEAFLPGLERVVIDRFDLVSPPEGAPGGERRIDPARYAEDWAALDALFDRSWPVTGSDHALRAAGIVCDMRGEAGVTPNAQAYWRASALRWPRRFHLVMGVPGESAPRAKVQYPERAHGSRRRPAARDLPVLRAGIDRLKDEVAAALLRRDAGARKLHVPRGAPGEMFAEYAAERRGVKGWEARPGVARNEALDLSVYTLALAVAMEAEAIDWEAPPDWARPGAGNLMATGPGGGDGAAPPAPEAERGWVVKRPRRKW